MKRILIALLSVGLFFSQAQAEVLNQSKDLEVSAKKSDKKSEPAPKDKSERKGENEGREPRLETYEGNDRDQGTGVGGGRFEEDGGFAGELFRVQPGRAHPITTSIKTEDRGDVIVQTIIQHEEVSAEETCMTKTVTIINKSNQKVISSETEEFCNRYAL